MASSMKPGNPAAVKQGNPAVLLGRQLDLKSTLSLLGKYALPFAKTVFVETEKASKLFEEAKKMRSPLVLKGLAKEVAHKTEAGFVVLNIKSEEELEAAADQIKEAAATRGVALEGLVLQEHASGIELIIGGKRDPVFGPTILFGSGGVLTELFSDVAIRVCPVGESDAREMISETKASRFFAREGFRGRCVDEGKVVEIIVSTSKLLEENPEVLELDFNPVIARNESVLIADARIITKD